MKHDDLLILSHLRSNARKSLVEISLETNIPHSTIHHKLKSFEQGIVKKHTSLLDFKKLGYDHRSCMVLKVDKKDTERLENFLYYHTNVNSLFRVDNGYAFMIDGVFKNIKQRNQFLEYVEETFNLVDKQVYDVVEDVKQEAMLNHNEVRV